MTSRWFTITAILAVLLFVQSYIFGAEDISVLLEKKGPWAVEVFTKPTITRVSELPNLPISSKQYEFFIDHPRLSMVLARIYDPSLDSYRVSVRHDGLIHVEDPNWLEGDVEVIGSGHGSRIYLIKGSYYLLKIWFRGSVLMVTQYTENKVGESSNVDVKASSYIKVDSAFAGVFARIVNLLFPKKVDGRIARFTHAVKSAALAVHTDPEGAYRRLSVAGEVDPKELKEFASMFALIK